MVSSSISTPHSGTPASMRAMVATDASARDKPTAVSAVSSAAMRSAPAMQSKPSPPKSPERTMNTASSPVPIVRLPWSPSEVSASAPLASAPLARALASFAALFGP